MEAALVNVLSPGDAMLALVAGSFGERWAALGRAHGMDVRELERAVGRGRGAGARGRGAGRATPASRAVFVQLSESSTGAAPRHRGAGAGSRAQRPARCWWWTRSPAPGAMPLETAGLGRGRGGRGQPEGAGPAARAWPSSGGERAGLGARRVVRDAPRFYFDLRRERKAQADGESAFTPGHLARGRAAARPSTPRGGAWAGSTRWSRTRARWRP